MRYSTEPWKRNMLKDMVFWSFARKCTDNFGKKLMDNATKTRIDAAKAACC